MPKNTKTPTANQVKQECRESLAYAFQEIQDICDESIADIQARTKKITEQSKKLKTTIKQAEKGIADAKKALKSKTTKTLQNKVKTLTTRLKTSTKDLTALEKEAKTIKEHLVVIKEVKAFEKARAVSAKQFTLTTEAKAKTSKTKTTATKAQPSATTAATSTKKASVSKKTKPGKTETKTADQKTQSQLEFEQALESAKKEMIKRELGEGDRAPDFKAEFDEGEHVSLSDLRGKNVVLYFYPRDDTPGCTQQALDFTDHLEQFDAKDTVIIGVSRDGLSSHQNFKQKYDITYKLLADTDEQVCNTYGVIKDKNMYGKIVRGIERSTFIIDKQGVIRAVWRKVKVPGHIYEVISAVEKI